MRKVKISRQTKETSIKVSLNIDGKGEYNIDTGIPFLDHMLSLFAAHSFFDLDVKAKGDIEVDFHHTTEDIGIILGQALSKALGDKKGIYRYGFFTLPMDETLCSVTIDLSNRPFFVFNTPKTDENNPFNLMLAKEFFRALSNNLAMNLHINVDYGENEHHIIEAIFKAFAKAMNMAVAFDKRIKGVLSTKGTL